MFLLASGPARAAGGDEALKAAPAPVQKTIRAEAQGATIVSVDQKAHDGAVRYKVIMSLPGGKQRRAFVDSSGKLLRLKNDVDADKLPAAVRKTVDAQAQGGKIIRSTQVTQDGRIQYEVELDTGGHKKEVLIDPAGAVAKVEEVVQLAAVPGPVKSEIEKIVGKAKLLQIEAITASGKPTIYEAEYESGKTRSEVKIAADGRVLERE